MSSRAIYARFTFLFTALFIFFVSSVYPQPLSAQTEAEFDADTTTDDEDATGEDEAPNKPLPPRIVADMAYQPPADASQLADFYPRTARVENNNLSSATSPLSGSMASAEVDEVVTTALDINASLLGIVIEPGTVPTRTRLVVADLVTHTVSISESRPLIAPTQLIEFSAELVDQVTDKPIAQFDKRARIVTDLRSFGIDTEQMGGVFYLAYQDPQNPQSWIDVPITLYDTKGLISADVEHFSNWSAGWRPEAWALEWKPPAVSLFTGSASYNLPIEVPPGRAGLQPQLNLSYSSASLNGAILKVSPGKIATGWTLTDINIQRTGTKQVSTGYEYTDDFRLTINGTGSRLIFQQRIANTGSSTVKRENERS